MNIGALNTRVMLANAPTETDDADGFYEPLSPPKVWASIETQSPGSSEGRSLSHLVTMWFHPEVGLETRITFTKRGVTRELFVRGLQPVGDELRLLCEEVLP